MATRGERSTRKTQPPRNRSHDATPRNQHGPTKPAPPVGPAYLSTHTMINRINNAICFLIVAAVFAMIGIESGNQAGATHSGTQQVVRHD